jgi:hypothetical protein
LPSSMPRSQILRLLLAGFAAFAIATPLAFAADAAPAIIGQPPIKTKHYLSGSFTVELTGRGEKQFNSQLSSIISNLGYSFNEAYFSDLKWQSTVSYDLDNADIDPDAKKLVLTIRDALKSWFVGFPLGSIRPAIEIGNSNYQAEFNKFSITTDEALLHKLKKTSGAILVLDLDIKELDLNASKIKVWDMNAPTLGEIAVDSAELKVAGGATSLQIRVPLYATVNKQGIPSFEAIEVDQNFDKINLDLSHSQIMLPQIQLVINGVSYPFNTTALGQAIEKNTPAFLVELTTYLHTFTSQQLPALLNQKVKQYLVNAIEQEQILTNPPGAQAGSKVQFPWGLRLQNLDESQGLKISLDSFVEDPKYPNSLPAPTDSSHEKAQLNDMNKTDYDLAVAINQGMINRLLQLSFQEQLFSHMAIDNGAKDPKCDTSKSQILSSGTQFFKMTEAPRIGPLGNYALPKTSVSSPGAAYARLSLSVQVPKGSVPGWRTWFIKDEFIVGFDVIVKVAKTTDNKGMQIYLWDIDESSINIDKNDISFFGGLVKGMIVSTIKTEFTAIAQNWRCKDIALPGNVPVPVVYGIEFVIDQLNMEESGNLVLYLNSDAGVPK